MSSDHSNRSGRPIPTPLRIRVSRASAIFAPPIVFITCVALSAWMWSRHTAVSSIMGRVEAKNVEVAAPPGSGGLLTAAAPDAISLLGEVHSGQLLFRIDDRPALAELAIVQAELSRQRATLAARSRDLAREHAVEHRGQEISRQRLAVEVAERELDVLDRRATLAANRIELQRIDLEVAQLDAMVGMQAETEYTLRTTRLRRESLATRIAEDESALARSESDAIDGREKLSALPEPLELDTGDLVVLLAPFEAEIEVVRRRLDALRVAIDSLEIRAPFAGVITAVHRQSGDIALPGEPLVTMTDPSAVTVLAYLPEVGPLEIELDQGVSIRTFGGARGSRATLDSRIFAVGARIDQIPIEFRRDPSAADRPVWGLPVRMELPTNSGLRPGQRVEVRLLGQ